MDLKTIEIGEDLNVLVAEKVMGLEHREWKPYYSPEGWYPKDFKDAVIGWEHPDGYSHHLPCYSTEISEAWAVVTKMRQKIFSKRQLFLKELARQFPLGGSVHVAWPDVFFSIEPVHICKAALKVMLQYPDSADFTRSEP